MGLPFVQDAVEYEGHGLLVLDRLGEQAVQEMDRHSPVAEELLEEAVLLLRPGGPDDVVEEQRVLVARGQPLDVRSGLVQDDLFQLTDLRIHMEHALS